MSRAIFQRGMRGAALAAAACAFVTAQTAQAQSGFWSESPDGFWKFGLQPEIELRYWHTDTPSPGLLGFGDTDFLDPRLLLRFTAMAGDHWLLHVRTSWDRGFDPGARSDGDFRVDEMFLRWRPLGDTRLNVQLGKFPTCFGSWVKRHEFWDDPFLTAPLPYENLLAASDRSARNPSPATIATRTTGKRAWLPMIWGPNYTTGASVFGSSGKWDYAVECKNASINSRPDSWNLWDEGFSHPTVTGRIGFRPDAAWAFGMSASYGSYLRSDAATTLPSGVSRGDFSQTVLGADVRWSHHHLELQGEVIASRAETATAGNLDALAYYLEGRWKVTTGLFLAARWAQGWNDDFVSSGPSAIRGYRREVWRATGAAGFRVTRNVLVKAEYSYNGGDARENTVALGLGFKF